jgi:EAL and modified HD-GYP domain-containing signal transduction protein
MPPTSGTFSRFYDAVSMQSPKKGAPDAGCPTTKGGETMMTDSRSSAPQAATVSLARRPVFDDKRRLWGYELFRVGGERAPGDSANIESAATSLAKSAYIGLQNMLDRGKKIVLDFTAKGLLDDLPYVLPPASAVVQVDETVLSSPDVVPSLKRLKTDGFLVAVDGFTGSPAGDPFYRIADIISIAVDGKRGDDLTAVMDFTRRYDVLTMATGVQDPALFEACREMGFSLYSGAFFKTPDVIKLRRISPSEVSHFRLLRLFEMQEPDIDVMAETIQTDVSVSYRLLAYLNSAAFGFPQKIKSIRQAIALLGWNKMKNWLRVSLIMDVSRNKDAAELMLLAVQRGKFLELIATDYDYWGFDPDTLNLLGTFSLLDVMLGLPMADIVAHLPLDTKLQSALCGDPNSEYAPLLQLACLFEEARWLETEKMIQRLNLDDGKVRGAFQRAVDWAVELTTLPEDN